ncbi:hypothetical protein TFLX_05813 [Thermoflexales bacterium]|nr:hypothetical protein TFLX_05813 [Thermoflexales bacterium]
MPKSDQPPSYTALAHQVVQAAREPLPFDEIMRRVHRIRPIDTKNPTNTIRNALSQSRLIVNTGDGRYGWILRLINGSVMRVTLTTSALSGTAIELGDDTRELLWPTFFEIQARCDRSPINLRLPDRTTVKMELAHLHDSQWGMAGPVEFWRWFKTLRAKVGDQLLLRAITGEQKLYAVDYQPRAARDEAAIAARNQAVVQAAVARLRRSPYGMADWDLIPHLLATGLYRDPIPPDPLAEIWTEDIWRPVLAEKKPPSRTWVRIATTPHNKEYPADLPREHQAGPDRRPRPSRQAQRGPVKTFVLRVSHRALPKVWRDIEIAADQTLEDLHLMIQQAFDWNDDHLYSFFMSGQVYDQTTEIGSPWSETKRHTQRVTIGELDLSVCSQFLYYFDYGDSHEFDVQVKQINAAAPTGNYPRLVAQHGQAPPQYPEIDEETGEMAWDPYARPALVESPLDDTKRSNRKMLHRIWQRAQAGKSLQGEEALLAEIMREHPEWHHVWNRLDKISDAQLEKDGVNPVMHLVVHETILNQITGALPPVAEIYQKILAQGIDRHEVIHRIGAVFMEEFYRALKADRPFDETRYLLQLKQLVHGKAQPLRREPRPRRRR